VLGGSTGRARAVAGTRRSPRRAAPPPRAVGPGRGGPGRGPPRAAGGWGCPRRGPREDCDRPLEERGGLLEVAPGVLHVARLRRVTATSGWSGPVAFSQRRSDSRRGPAPRRDAGVAARTEVLTSVATSGWSLRAPSRRSGGALVRAAARGRSRPGDGRSPRSCCTSPRRRGGPLRAPSPRWRSPARRAGPRRRTRPSRGGGPPGD